MDNEEMPNEIKYLAWYIDNIKPEVKTKKWKDKEIKRGKNG